MNDRKALLTADLVGGMAFGVMARDPRESGGHDSGGD